VICDAVIARRPKADEAIQGRALELTRFDGHQSICEEVSTMGKYGWYDRSRRAYPPEFREQIVELHRAGRSTTDLARSFGPHPQSIRNWVASAKGDAREDGKAGKGTLSASEREELDRLRRENRQLRLDREILSKAAAWFARETSRIPPKDSDS
jgi:transposase